MSRIDSIDYDFKINPINHFPTCLLLQLPRLTKRDNLHSPSLLHASNPAKTLAAQRDGGCMKQFSKR